jgi:putative glycosyltransferase (TIGR04348 family)
MEGMKPQIAIISPALANANNGNWQTAWRWARHLRERYSVILEPSWDPAASNIAPDAVIALHARRSAAVIAALAEHRPSLPIALVLTGTDLYRDIRHDADARRSLDLATCLVVLQEAGLDELGPEYRQKASVIYQSAPSLKPAARSLQRKRFEVVMIGHLRDEKDPAIFMRAATLTGATGVRYTHVGGALDEALGAQAEATQHATSQYRWLGNQPHGKTRQLLKRADLMAICSKMEGGANVIIEAVTSGVPVVASDISGNRGMLGADYAGYFPLGDAAALAALIERAAADPAFHARLKEQCATRASLFAPEREKAAVLQLADNLIHS